MNNDDNVRIKLKKLGALKELQEELKELGALPPKST